MSTELKVAIAIMFIGTALGTALIILTKSEEPAPTCADYANSRREFVPARCFGDFHPERP